VEVADKIVKHIGLGRAKKLIAAHRDLLDDSLRKALFLLSVFGADPDLFNIREKHFKKAMYLLEEFHIKKLNCFDPFHIAGFIAHEDNFSDVIAALLNPNRPHGLGDRPLKCFLKKLRPQNPKRVQPVLRALDQSNRRIRVGKRLWRKGCVPDIVIASDDFIIYIENKLRGGKETVNTAGKFQTQGHKEDLQD